MTQLESEKTFNERPWLRNWKTWAALSAVLLSGIVIGITGTLLYVKSTITGIMEGDFHRLTTIVINRLDTKLDLDAAQKKQLEKIVLSARDQLLELRQQYRPRVEEIIEQSATHIETFLRAPQKEKLKRMLQRFKNARLNTKN